MDSSSPTFLIERIRRQAQAEGVPLSQEEEMFLESATAGHKDEARAALKNLKEHESMLEFGRRMVGLLMRAYEEDVKADPQAKERYAQQSEFFASGPNIFSAMLPLIAGRSHGHGQQQSFALRQQDIAPPVVEPKSSSGAFLLLLVLIAIGFILWFVITRR